jgi:exodeoxyribonuclease-5
MKSESTFIEEVTAQLNVALKNDQLRALQELYRFLFEGGSDSIFILKGYAGTGKTTLMGALIRWFHAVNRKTVLLAPTGRSAKVLASLSGFPASTIHRRIYSIKESDGGYMFMQLSRNTAEKTMFFVDEASMIGEFNSNEENAGNSLLEDLITYVRSGERCRLIFIGDDAQLPPVGADMSPALDAKRLAAISNGPVYKALLDEVVRQASGSPILQNATNLRRSISNQQFDRLKLEVASDGQVALVDPYDLEDQLSRRFSGDTADDTIILCRSNKDAYRFNQQIRSRILFKESEIEAGDRLMIVKNNYKQKLPGSRQNFLANGDMITIERVYAVQSFGEFRFAEAQVYFTDEPGVSFDLILLLNSLEFEGPSIPSKALKVLRNAMIASGALDDSEAEEKFFQNPYFNAVQVKYAYAVTCHKAQGGQWKYVYLYPGYFNEEMLDRSYFRWMYTAVTRASDELKLIQFPEELLNFS